MACAARGGLVDVAASEGVDRTAAIQNHKFFLFCGNPRAEHAGLCYNNLLLPMRLTGRKIGMQNRLTVTIAGQKFSLVADEPEAYMKEIAALADQKIAEAKKLVGNTTFSTGVLATLNMADEAVKLRHQCEEYKNQAQEQQEALAKSKSELGLMQDELDTMRRARPDEDPAVLLAEIKRLEKELDT